MVNKTHNLIRNSLDIEALLAAVGTKTCEHTSRSDAVETYRRHLGYVLNLLDEYGPVEVQRALRSYLSPDADPSSHRGSPESSLVNEFSDYVKIGPQSHSEICRTLGVTESEMARIQRIIADK